MTQLSKNPRRPMSVFRQEEQTNHGRPSNGWVHTTKSPPNLLGVDDDDDVFLFGLSCWHVQLSPRTRHFFFLFFLGSVFGLQRFYFFFTRVFASRKEQAWEMIQYLFTALFSFSACHFTALDTHTHAAHTCTLNTYREKTKKKWRGNMVEKEPTKKKNKWKKHKDNSQFLLVDHIRIGVHKRIFYTKNTKVSSMNEKCSWRSERRRRKKKSWLHFFLFVFCFQKEKEADFVVVIITIMFITYDTSLINWIAVVDPL